MLSEILKGARKIKDNITLKTVLVEILDEVRDLCGCQSVGVRIQANGDYPYYVHEGFPNFFILKENYLCAKDEKGQDILDEQGRPSLECMCGNVLEGRFDPKLPFFTEKGSFWTNNTTQLLKSTTENDRQGRTRNMCHNSGYESVALIPLKAEGRTYGLIQMNDPRENRFTLQKIKNYESLADQIATVISNAFEIQERMKKISDSIKKSNRQNLKNKSV